MTETTKLNLFPKTVYFYGQENIEMNCALCATKGKTTTILIDSNKYYVNRHGTACHSCMSTEFEKEERTKRSEYPYHSEYLPPKKLCDMTWDELGKQESQDMLLEYLKDQEISKLIERNASVARQFALGVPDTEEQREKYKKIFINKGPWEREITGIILEQDEPEEKHSASWHLDDIERRAFPGTMWNIS